MGASVLAVLAALSPAPRAEGGTERTERWDRPIAYAWADAGEIVGRSVDTVRWRLPNVCARVRTTLHFQAEDGVTQHRAVDVMPPRRMQRPALVIITHSDIGHAGLQFASDRTVRFAVSSGETEPSIQRSECAAALWRLPKAQRPDWAVAAAFDPDGTLLDWRAQARTVARIQEVEAPSGTSVIVSVAGRLFSASAGDGGVAPVPIEIPPGIDQAMVFAIGDAVPHDLGTPAPTTEHQVVAPDGAHWIFRVARDGRADDGPPPVGEAMRKAPGAFRIPNARAAENPVIPSRASVGTWRIGVGSHIGRVTRRGIGAFGGWARDMGLVDPGVALAITFSGIQNDQIGGTGFVQDDALAVALSGEATLEQRVGHARIALSPGVGAAFARLRSIASDRGLEERTVLGPLLTCALRLGVGPIDAEARALWSTVTLRPEASRLGWLLGLAWVFRWGT